MTYEILRHKTRLQAMYWITENLFIFSLIIGTGAYSHYYSFMKYWGLYFIPLLLSSLKYFQFTIYAGLIKRKLHVLVVLLRNMRIKDCNERKNTNETVKVDLLNMHLEFIHIRRCLHLLWEANQLINDCFHWTLLFLIGNDFAVLVKNLYWIFFWLEKSTHIGWPSFLLSCQWSLMNISHFGIVCNVCYEANRNFRRISGLIHQINIRMTDRYLNPLVSDCVTKCWQQF